ncbi:hypothetical protein GCM10020370_70320 [Paenibacillus hodogayensis]
MVKNRVLITTTSVNDLIQLEHYKGIVSARVVTGVDLFSDIFASLATFLAAVPPRIRNS